MLSRSCTADSLGAAERLIETALSSFPMHPPKPERGRERHRGAQDAQNDQICQFPSHPIERIVLWSENLVGATTARRCSQRIGLRFSRCAAIPPPTVKPATRIRGSGRVDPRMTASDLVANNIVEVIIEP